MPKQKPDSEGAPNEELDSVNSPGQQEEVVNEGSSEETQPELTDEEKAEKRKADTEAAIRERQAEFTKLSQQVAELRGQLSIISDQRQSKQEDEVDWLDDETFREKITEDPQEVANALKRMRTEFVQVLRMRDQALKAEMLRTNPVYEELEKEAEKLSKDPDYNGFSFEQLITIAKKNRGQETKPELKQIPGRFGGQKVKTTQKQADITSDPFYQRLYGDLEEEGK